MILFFYNVALLAGSIASAPWWLWRMATTHKYREGIRERLGQVPGWLKSQAGKKPVIWLHAVSVGEVLAVSRLIAELDKALPAFQVFVSTTTRTGHALARERFGANRVFYCPLDLPWAVHRVSEDAEAAHAGPRRDRILAQPSSQLRSQANSRCRRERAHLRSLLATLPDSSESLAAVFEPDQSCVGSDGNGCGTA